MRRPAFNTWSVRQTTQHRRLSCDPDSLCLTLLLAATLFAQETDPRAEAFKAIETTLETIQNASSEEEWTAAVDKIFQQSGDFLDTHSAAADAEQLDLAVGIWLEIALMKEMDPEAIQARIDKTREIENLPESVELALVGAEATIHPLEAGSVAPAWTAVDVHATDQEVSLRDFAGKLVLVDFWAVWCGPCKELMRSRLAPLYEKYGKHEGFALIGMGVNWDETPEDQAAYGDEQGYGWKKVHDLSGRIAASYGVQGIPFLCLSDGEGKILAVGSGFEVIDEIEKILAERLTVGE